MPRIAYGPQKRWSPTARSVVATANAIIEEYAAQGFALTLRQLYYQFVARGFLANKQTEYKRLGSIVNDARYAGFIDWKAIVDRTRNLRALSHWESPEQIVEAVADQYRRERWATQPYYCEVWIEKDALLGVIEPVCNELDVPFFSCRGYTSASEVWVAAQRIGAAIQKGKKAKVLHLGDHDPSGIDMTRDIEDRLTTFLVGDLLEAGFFGQGSEESLLEEAVAAWSSAEPLFEVSRLALNLDQVREFNPPPNPAKLTDSRSGSYISEFGGESWELDALEPAVMASLIRDAVEGILDVESWDEATRRQEQERARLAAVSQRWVEVTEYVEGLL